MFVFGHYKLMNENLVEDELILMQDKQTAEDAMRAAIADIRAELEDKLMDVSEDVRLSTYAVDKNGAGRLEVVLESYDPDTDSTQKDVFFVYQPSAIRKKRVSSPRLKAIPNLAPRAPVENVSQLPITKAEAQEAIALRNSIAGIKEYMQSIDYRRFNLNALEYAAQAARVPGRTQIIKNLKGDEKKLVLYNAIMDM